MFNLINGSGPVVGEAMSAHSDIDMMASFTKLVVIYFIVIYCFKSSLKVLDCLLLI